jgi:hypothetical protein
MSASATRARGRRVRASLHVVRRGDCERLHSSDLVTLGWLSALLGGACELSRGRGVIGREDRKSEIHWSSSCRRVRFLTRARSG